MAAPKNDFVPFANGSGANVVDQATWKALPQLSTGFTSGIASSAQMNKAFRQSSIMSAVLAQFIADKTGNDVIDDGTTATILTNLNAAIIGMIGSQTSGLMSLTNGGTINGPQPTVGFNQTNLSGGAGYWLLQANNGNFYLHRNTSSSRNFATFTTPVAFDATDIATFIQPPIAPSPAANDNSQKLAPTSWVKAAISSALATIGGFLPLTGGTLTGPLNLSSNPLANDNTTAVPTTSWIWGNIRALVQSCLSTVWTALGGYVFITGTSNCCRLPTFMGSWIIQWGRTTFSSNGMGGYISNVTLAIGYPNTHVYASAILTSGSPPQAAPISILSMNNSAVSFGMQNNATAPSSFSGCYISIGH